MMTKKLALAFASAVAACCTGSLAASGCSSSSSGSSVGADAAFNPATYDGAIGVGLVNCVPSNCLSNDLCNDGAAPNCAAPAK